MGAELYGQEGPVDGTARIVRISKGSTPTYTGLNPLQALAWKYFRHKYEIEGAVDPSLEEDLLKSHMRIGGKEYMAFVMFTTYLLLVVGVGLAVALAVVGIFLLGTGPIILLFSVIAGVFTPVGGYVVLRSLPSSRAKTRGREIDKRISSTMSFISAMASADVNIDTIFKELAKEKIYGEVAEEAAWITRDTELLGIDILTALKQAAARTPSRRMQDFLQGVVTTATTGGQLKPYFLINAEQYERENKLDMAKRIETMGLMAETFVTVVVAFPLFLIIMIAIFTVVGTGGGGMSFILWAIVAMMLPALQFVFIWMMMVMSKEGAQ